MTISVEMFVIPFKTEKKIKKKKNLVKEKEKSVWGRCVRSDFFAFLRGS